MRLQKISNNIFLIILIYILIIIFMHNNNLWRKFYNILNDNYNSRLIKKSGFCNKDSYGFLRMVKKKHQLKENPMIINYAVIPNTIWSIYDASKKNSTIPNILLNYKKDLNIGFVKKDSSFQSNQHVQHTDELTSIKFLLTDDKLKINNFIKIYKTINNKNYIIFRKKINQKLINNKEINISFKTAKFNSRWGPVYFDIENLESDKIKKIEKIILKLNNKYDLSKYEIIEKYENCYYIK